jgi:predicted nucleic acid-binding protein
MNAVDTNVLIYSVDQKEPTKQAKAHQLLQILVNGAEATVLLWQVLAETARQLRRWKDQGELTESEFVQHVQAFRLLFPLVLPIEAVFDRALDLASRFSLSHWDSMILGACKEAHVTTLYTEDMGAPTTIDGIQLVNPLI